MCGIAGAFGARVGLSDRIVAGVDAAGRSMVHRGPDDTGRLRRDHAVLAHERLSIIDLSPCGHQPMCNETGDVWVVYNGEIYNYPELRRTLAAAGHHFRSTSDTEVLIHGYEEWGMRGLVERLRGMFAFALHDARPSALAGGASGHFYLVRDRFGIKPLYYAGLENGAVAFASEVRALAAGALVDTATDPRATLGFLLFGSVPSPLTTLQHVRAIPPGHYLRLAPAPSLERYYDVASLFHATPPATTTSDTSMRELLEETVRIHLLSDAPLGVFLSGGIDSSALVGLAAGAVPELRTVSIVFDDERFSEKPYQDAVRERFGTRHHEIRVTAEQMSDALPAFAAAMDQPTVDGLNTYFVAHAARQAGLTVVLSGLGGDEVFGGYETLRRAPVMHAIQRMPGFAVRAAARVAPRRYARKLDYLAGDGPLPLYLAQRGLFSPREVSSILGCAEREVWDFARDVASGDGARDARTLQQLLEFQHYLPDQLLRDSDVFGMAHSLEIRVPFLDHVLAERVLRLPASFQRDAKWPKPALTLATRDLLPEKVVFRRKQGFTFPFAPWLAAGAGGLGERLMSDPGTAPTWRAFQRGDEHWSRPWALDVLKRFSGAS